LLLAERRRQPDREVVGAVVVIVELGEELAAHPPGGLPPRDLLRALGQRQTDRAQPVDRRARRATARLRCAAARGLAASSGRATWGGHARDLSRDGKTRGSERCYCGRPDATTPRRKRCPSS